MCEHSIFYSILFYSILFYSILFYSILFYSILFYSIPKNIPICIQQDITLHSLFYLETALHVSGGTTTHHQERKQLYLQHLVFATTDVVDRAVCALDDGWWYHPKHVEQFLDKINCVTLYLVGYI